MSPGFHSQPTPFSCCFYGLHEVGLPAHSSDDRVLREDDGVGARLRPAEPREQDPDQEGVDEQANARLQAQHRQHDPAGAEEVVVGPVPYRGHRLQGKQEALSDARQLQVAPQGKGYRRVHDGEEEDQAQVLDDGGERGVGGAGLFARSGLENEYSPRRDNMQELIRLRSFKAKAKDMIPTKNIVDCLVQSPFSSHSYHSRVTWCPPHA